MRSNTRCTGRALFLASCYYAVFCMTSHSTEISIYAPLPHTARQHTNSDLFCRYRQYAPFILLPSMLAYLSLQGESDLWDGWLFFSWHVWLHSELLGTPVAKTIKSHTCAGLPELEETQTRAWGSRWSEVFCFLWSHTMLWMFVSTGLMFSVIISSIIPYVRSCCAQSNPPRSFFFFFARDKAVKKVLSIVDCVLLLPQCYLINCADKQTPKHTSYGV